MKISNVLATLFSTFATCSLYGMQPQEAQPNPSQEQLVVHRSCPSLLTMALTKTTMNQLKSRTDVPFNLTEAKSLYSLPQVSDSEQMYQTVRNDNQELFKLLLWQQSLDKETLKGILPFALDHNRLWPFEHFLGTVERVDNTALARTENIDQEMYTHLKDSVINHNSPVLLRKDGSPAPLLKLITEHQIAYQKNYVAPVRNPVEQIDQELTLHKAAQNNDLYTLHKHLSTPEGLALLNSSVIIENVGYTPFDLAIYRNNPDAVQLLLDVADTCGIENTLKPEYLNMACYQGNPRTVQLLTQRGASVTAQDPNRGDTPLHNAVSFECRDNNQQDTIADYLISNGATCTVVNNAHETPLHVAVRSFNDNRHSIFENVVKLLVANGAPLDAQDSDGNTALHIIMAKKRYSAPEKSAFINLLATEGNVNLPNNKGERLAFMAVREKTVGPIKTLIAHGANLSQKDIHGNTLLHVAAEAGTLANVKELLSKKITFNLPNNNGAYPLHCAAGCSARFSDEIVTLFLQRTSVIDVNDRDGNTSLHYAMRDSECETDYTVKALVFAGANVNAQNNEGKTPLFYAANNKYVNKAKLLIERGADLSLRQNDGTTVLEYVESLPVSKPALIKLLRKASAAQE